MNRSDKELGECILRGLADGRVTERHDVYAIGAPAYDGCALALGLLGAIGYDGWCEATAEHGGALYSYELTPLLNCDHDTARMVDVLHRTYEQSAENLANALIDGTLNQMYARSQRELLLSL